MKLHLRGFPTQVAQLLREAAGLRQRAHGAEAREQALAADSLDEPDATSCSSEIAQPAEDQHGPPAQTASLIFNTAHIAA